MLKGLGRSMFSRFLRNDACDCDYILYLINLEFGINTVETMVSTHKKSINLSQMEKKTKKTKKTHFKPAHLSRFRLTQKRWGRHNFLELPSKPTHRQLPWFFHRKHRLSRLLGPCATSNRQLQTTRRLKSPKQTRKTLQQWEYSPEV